MQRTRRSIAHLGIGNHHVVLTVLLVLSLGGAMFPAWAKGDAADSSRRKADSLGTCIADCIGRECLRACIAEEPTKDGARSATVETSIIDCLGEVLVNVVTCADVFLGEDPDSDGYWVCIGGAATRYLQCNSSTSSISSATRPLEDKDALRLVLVVAETRFQASIPFGTESYKGGAEISLQQQVADTFATCASQLHGDRNTCSVQFPNDPDGQSVCNEGSKARFLGCVKALDVVATE